MRYLLSPSSTFHPDRSGTRGEPDEHKGDQRKTQGAAGVGGELEEDMGSHRRALGVKGVSGEPEDDLGSRRRALGAAGGPGEPQESMGGQRLGTFDGQGGWSLRRWGKLQAPISLYSPQQSSRQSREGEEEKWLSAASLKATQGDRCLQLPHRHTDHLRGCPDPLC